MDFPQPEELQVASLGRRRVDSPLRERRERFVADDERVLLCSTRRQLERLTAGGGEPPTFERAGPRAEVFFDGGKVSCGIVTCGGLCPGLNNVIRSLVLTLSHGYGVRRILGFRYGYAGLTTASPFAPLALTPPSVESIHEQGGTLLGSSRGPQDVGDMVDSLARHGVAVLFAIGGDGTLRGASALTREIARRGLAIAVVGVPKTIDNDIRWVEHSFGFSTAVESAAEVILAAHAEARGAWNGVGLVKLMGRHAGFITAHATLANADVNFCLVPEVPFTLEGRGGFLEALEERLASRHHAVVVVAEGAGQEWLGGAEPAASDASGNLELRDVGRFLERRIRRHFAASGVAITIKYIDPSYIIRSQPASSTDAELCLMLGQHAAHAGMAGKTDLLVGTWNQHFTHVPLPVAAAQSQQLDRTGAVWQRVLGTTGQPASMVGSTEEHDG